MEYIISTTNMPDHILEVAAPWCNAEVIRCMDCKHSAAKGVVCYRFMTIDTWENPVPSEVEPDGFCKWGERL